MTRTILVGCGLVITSMVMGQGSMSDHFVTTWKTTNPGISNNTSITIPTASGETYNYDVDWDNDGVFDQLGITGAVTHAFGDTGTYTIRIQGTFPRIHFNSTGDHEKILDVAQWGSIQWTSMYRAFHGCYNLDVSAIDTPDLSGVEACFQMFYNCSTLVGTPAFSAWDVSNVVNMVGMFERATHFNQPIGSWEVSNVNSMRSMFEYAYDFNQPLGSWDVSNVTDMRDMFYSASEFNQDISSWDVSNVSFMGGMFRGASSFDQPLASWNVSQVSQMTSMFQGAHSFDQPIGVWDVSNVTSMSFMFSYATSFDQPIGIWNVANVTSMTEMFRGASSFDQSLGAWNVANVTGMWKMFNDATMFGQDLSSWDVGSILTAFEMFDGSGLSVDQYDSLLIGWARLDPGETQIPQNVAFGAGGLTFCQGSAARDSLMFVHGWTITDDGLDPNCTINSCPEDINGDGLVKYAGAANDRDHILQFIGGTIPTNAVPCSGCPEDVNGDGVVKYSGADNDRDLILQRIGGTVPTNTYVCP